MRSRNSLVASCLIVTAALIAQPRQSQAADPAAALRQALGSQAPLYKVSPADLAAAVKLCASRDPAHAGEPIALILASGRNDADAIAPSLVQAAIQGLGPDPKSSVIAAIVKAAVSATPSEVMDIVTAAVKASPRGAATAIVQAAVTAVPHPDSMVTVNVQPRRERTAGSGKEENNRNQVAPEQKQMTIAEAIVQAALDADPGLSADVLIAAVDSALGANFASNRPNVLTGVLAPNVPILPNAPVSP